MQGKVFAFLLISTAFALSDDYPRSWGVTSSSSEEVPESTDLVDLGVASTDQLRETRLCQEGKICRYKTNIFNKMSLDSDNGMTTGMGRSVGMPTKVTFEISSQCGTRSHELYRMDVTRYRVSSLRGNTHFMREYPIFFSVNRKTGRIHRVFSSKKERKSVRGTKISMLLQLARLVHPVAMKKAGEAERGGGARYVVEGKDSDNGEFRALHTVKSLGNGNMVLSERIRYSQPQLLAHNSRIVGSKIPLAIHRAKGSDTHLTSSGRVAALRDMDRVDIGHHTGGENSARETSKGPVLVGPGVGHSRAISRTRGRLISTRSYRLNCPADGSNNSNDETKEHEEERHEGKGKSDSSNIVEEDDQETVPPSIASALQDVDTRDFRTPLTIEDWGTDDDDSREAIIRHVHRAQKIMSRPNFDIADLWETLKPSTIRLIVRCAKRRFAEGRMSSDDLSTVIGAVAGVRSKDSYDELIKFLKNKNLPLANREDAAVALVHTNLDSPAPWHVVNTVSAIAHDPTDEVSGTARLVLGSLLRSHPNERATHEHIHALKSRLHFHRAHLLKNQALEQKEKAKNVESMDIEDIVVMNLQEDEGEQALDEEQQQSTAGLSSSSSSSSYSPLDNDDNDANERVHWAVAADTINLLHTFGNIGPTASPFVLSDIEEFANHCKDQSVRRAARLALKSIKGETEREENNMNDDDNNSNSALEEGTTTISDLQDAPFKAQPVTTPNEELSAVKRKPLIDYNKIIYGNDNVEIRSVSKLGVKYGGHSIGSFGFVALHARVLDFKVELAKFEYNAGTQRKKDLSGAQGVMQYTFSIVGMVVDASAVPYSMGNVDHGGNCPSTWFDALTIKPARNRKWTRPLIVFPVMCGPALVTTAIIGTIGYVMAWDGYLNCVTSQGMEAVKGSPPPFQKTALKDGEASASSTIMGGNIKGKLDVIIMAAIEFGTGKPVGWTGKFQLYYGQMPGYCILDENMGVCHVDLDLQAMEGKLTLIGECFGPTMKKIMIEWHVPKMFKTLKERAYGPLVDGNLQGHPNCALQEALQLGMTYYDPSANKEEFSVNPRVLP